MEQWSTGNQRQDEPANRMKLLFSIQYSTTPVLQHSNCI
jgi:hypothetical protein